MTTLTLNRAAAYDYTSGYDFLVSPPTPIPFGDTEGLDDLEQCVLEFDIDPAAIDTGSAVTLQFKLAGCAAGTKYVRRWTEAFPPDGNFSALQSATALSNTTNQVSFTDTGTATVSLNVAALVADLATNSQPKVLLGIRETGNDGISGFLDNDANKPTLTYTALTLPTLTVSSSPASLDVGEGATGTVTRSGSTAGALVVNLSSDDTGAATVPATVTILDGQASATFTINAVGPGTPTITASYSGYTSGTASITTYSAPTISVVVPSASLNVGQSDATCYVSRSGGKPDAMVVTMANSNSGALTVPTTATIAYGQTSATFTVTGAGVGTATITATAPTATNSPTDTVTVYSAVTLGVTLSLDTIANGGATTATITRSGGDTANALTVTLGSSNASVATLPTSVTFASGSTSEQVTVSSVNVGTATITASYPGATSGTDVITIQGQVSVSLSPSTIYGTNTTTVTVTRTGTTASSAVLNLSSSVPGVATVPATVTIPSGQTSATETVTGVAVGTSNIDASNSLYTSTGAATVTVAEQITLAISLSPAAINADQTTTATVTRTASDVSQPLIVSLAGSNDLIATVPETVTIAATQTSNTVTVTGVGAGSVDISASHVSSSNTPSDTLTVSAPLVLAVAISPSTFNADQTGTVTVTRTGGDQTNPITVDLVSSNTGAATIPATVTILANENSGAVTLTGVAQGTTTVTASHADAADDATAVASINGVLGLNISLSPNPVNAGQTSTVTVTRAGGDQTAALVVTLASSNTSIATVPATVTIAANQTTATVSLSGVAPGSATITASHADAPTNATSSITVNDTLLLTASLATDPINVGQTSVLTVTRSGGNMSSALVVVLSSSVPTVATVPTSVTIPASTASATATVTGVSSGTSVISASNASAPTATDTITVNSSLVLGMTLARSTANAGQTVTGTVTRSGGNIAAALTVTLGSSNDAYATVPTTVTIPAGAISAATTVTAVAAGTATITASHASAASNGTAAIQVFAAPTLSVAAAPDPTFVGTPAVVTVTRSGGDVTQSMTVSLASSDTAKATLPASVLIAANRTTATATLTAIGDGVITITASHTDVVTDATDTITIYPTVVLGIVLSDSSVAAGGTSTATVSRSGGNTTTSLTVNLASNDIAVATVGSTVVIPANQLTATATVTAVGAGSASISASHADAPGVASASLDVTQPLTLAASLSPDTIAEGSTTKLTVVRSGGDLGAQLIVSLSSSDIVVAYAPATVTFGIGETSVEATITAIDNGTSVITANHVDAAAPATDTLTVTPIVVRRGGAPIIDATNHFEMYQRDDFKNDAEIGPLGPIRVETSLAITLPANRLRFGASRLRGSAANLLDNMIGTAYATAVAGEANQYDVFIETTKIETDKTIGDWTWDVECVFADADVRTVVSGTFTLLRSSGDNELRDPLNP